jgi:hypothetical protein
MDPAFLTDEGPRTLTDLDEDGEGIPALKALMQYENHQLAFFDPINCHEYNHGKFDMIAHWKDALYEPTHFDHIKADIESLNVFASFPMPEQKIFLIRTNNYIHAVSMRYRKRAIQKYIWSDITAYAALPLNYSCNK